MNHSPPSLAAAPSRPWGVGVTLVLAGGVFGVFLLMQSLVVRGMAYLHRPPLSLGEAAQSGWVVAIATITACPVGVGLILGIAKLRKQLPLREYLGLRRPQRRLLVEWCLITILCSMGLDLLKLLADLPIVPPSVIELYKTANPLPLFYLAVVVVGPIFEEALFRGFIYQGLRYSFLGIPGAIVSSAFLWAVIHLQYQWYDQGWIFIFGLLLGAARLRSRSIYVTLAMHALNNVLALLQVAASLYFA